MATCYDDDIGGCDFDAACKARTDETSWHFLRTCRACGQTWCALHCACDGVQHPCPHCGVRPMPEACPCEA